jgi:hypothetical protein
MRFDTKIAIVVRPDLAAWQQLNVTAFLASGVAGGRPEVMGEPYLDAAGTGYLALLRQPVLVYSATAAELTAVRDRALARQLDVAVYIEEMFKTGNDADNRAAVLAADPAALPLVGLAVYGPKSPMDKVLKGLTLHP